MAKISQYPTISTLTGQELVLMDSGPAANRQTVTATTATIANAVAQGLSVFSALAGGIVPASGGGAGKVLRSDATWSNIILGPWIITNSTVGAISGVFASTLSQTSAVPQLLCRSTAAGGLAALSIAANNGIAGSSDLQILQNGGNLDGSIINNSAAQLLLGTNGSAAMAIASDGGITVGSPTLGDLGAGTLNATGLFVNGQAVGVGSGSVSSVALSAPSIFSVAGSPITTTGTLALTFASGQTANRVLASPSGVSGAVSLRAITGADLPPIDLTSTANGGVSGNLPIARLNSGSGAVSTTYWSGAGSWTTPPGTAAGANPSASIGLSAVNGVAGTFMRSDAAQPLSQGIAPTWTGAHIFTPASGLALRVNAANTTVGAQFNSAFGTSSSAPQLLVSSTAASGFAFLSIAGNSSTPGTTDFSLFQNGSTADCSVLNRASAKLLLGTSGAAQMTIDSVGGVTVGSPTGGSKGAATLNAGNLYVNGVAVSTATPPGSANPSASLGLSAVNGVASTYMRSDAAPALSLAISPTWTATHFFTPAAGNALIAQGAANQTTVFVLGSTTVGQSKGLTIVAGTNAVDTAIQVSDATNTRSFFAIRGSGDGFFTNGSDKAVMTFFGSIGVNGATPPAKPTVTGSKGANAALTSLLAAMVSYGFITDSTT